MFFYMNFSFITFLVNISGLSFVVSTKHRIFLSISKLYNKDIRILWNES